MRWGTLLPCSQLNPLSLCVCVFVCACVRVLLAFDERAGPLLAPDAADRVQCPAVLLLLPTLPLQLHPDLQNVLDAGIRRWGGALLCLRWSRRWVEWAEER